MDDSTHRLLINNPNALSRTPLLRKQEKIYTFEAITRTRPPQPDVYDGSPHLERCLSWVDLLTYGISNTVGAGIFVITGQVAAQLAGPGIVLSFLFAGLASLISAFCYSEFSARIPLSGSAYTFTYATLGELVGWFIGWDITVEYAIGASAVAQGWSAAIGDGFKIADIHLPHWITGYEVNSFISIHPLSAIVVIVCSLVLLMGVKNSSRFNMVMTVINIGTIVLIIIVGASYVDTRNYQNFFPFGFTGVIKGAGKVFFSYIGFNSVTTLAAEVKKPRRDLPIGIVGSLLIATVLYIASSFVITGMVNYQHISTTGAFADAFMFHKLKWAAAVIVIGSITTMTATTFCALLGQPRIYYQMAKDGLLWKKFAQLNTRQVPWYGTIVTAVFSTVLALLFNLDQLSNMISVGTLLAFTLVSGGVIVLRYQDSSMPMRGPPLIPTLFATFCSCILFGLSIKFDWPWEAITSTAVVYFTFVALLLWMKPHDIYTGKMRNDYEVFECPFVPVLPLIGMLVNTVMIVQLDIWATVRVLVWAAIGMTIYFTYGIRNSTLNYEVNTFWK